jgi:hypothetical protein
VHACLLVLQAHVGLACIYYFISVNTPPPKGGGFG